VPSSFEALRSERRGGGPSADGRRDIFRLPAHGASVAEARRRVGARLCAWGVDDETNDDAGLVVSELFTNAVRYTSSEWVGCEFWVNDGVLHLEISDQGYGLTEPRPRVADVDEEGGRGLLLVSVLSQAWGVLAAEGGIGCIVWVELGLTADHH
jgi:anti-sigma regulatory factor (Ser/Thr protein kinase)